MFLRILLLGTLVAGCGASVVPILQPDPDGCRVSIKEVMESMGGDRADLLQAVVDADTADQAHRAILQFLLHTKKGEGTVPEAFCVTKSAVMAAPKLRMEAEAIWSYWNPPLVIAKSCTTEAFNQARRNLKDALLLAQVCGDTARIRQLTRNQKMLLEIQQQVLDLDLCARQEKPTGR